MTLKTVANITLAIACAAIFLIVGSPLAAQFKFNEAERYAKSGLPEKAAASFASALKLDPFNSYYLVKMGEFWLDRGLSGKGDDKVICFENAAKAYAEAARHNKQYPECYLKLGAIDLNIFLEDKERYKDRLASGMENFRRAFSLDPRGFYTSYSMGYIGVTAWTSLRKEDKDFLIERLRYALTVKPYHCVYVYLRLWKTTRNFRLLQRVTPPNLESNKILDYFIRQNELYQFRKIQDDMVRFYMKKEMPEVFYRNEAEKAARISDARRSMEPSYGVISDKAWRGKASFSDYIFNDGFMPTSGTIYAAVNMPAGKTKIMIKAKGTSAFGIYPYMVVELDGSLIGETFVNNSDWRIYEFDVTTPGGIMALSVTFENDDIDTSTGDDRNLSIGDTEVKPLEN